MHFATIGEKAGAVAVERDIRELEENVRRRMSGRLRNFRVSLHADGLVLHGHSTTYYAKQLAQHAIMAAVHVRIVANKIEVSAPAASY